MNTLLLITSIITMAIISAVGLMIYRTAHPERSTFLESGLEGIKTIEDLPWKWEKLSLKGHGKVMIRGWIVKADRDSPATSEKTFILIHGHKKNKIQMLGRGKLLHSLGYNLVFIDFRHHGESDDGPFGLGYFGRFDLQLLIDEVRTKIFPGSWTGVFGVSLGATTALATQAEFGSMDCIIADSPSSNQTTTLCEYGRRLYHTPFFLTKLALKLIEKYYGMNFIKLDIPLLIEKHSSTEQKNRETVEKKGLSSIPVLLLHGKKDNRVPFYHSEKILKAIKASKHDETHKNQPVKLVEFKDSNHVQGYSFERERYDSEIREFITRYACCPDA